MDPELEFLYACGCHHQATNVTEGDIEEYQTQQGQEETIPAEALNLATNIDQTVVTEVIDQTLVTEIEVDIDEYRQRYSQQEQEDTPNQDIGYSLSD
jgi:hypothetical protein